MADAEASVEASPVAAEVSTEASATDGEVVVETSPAAAEASTEASATDGEVVVETSPADAVDPEVQAKGDAVVQKLTGRIGKMVSHKDAPSDLKKKKAWFETKLKQILKRESKDVQTYLLQESKWAVVAEELFGHFNQRRTSRRAGGRKASEDSKPSSRPTSPLSGPEMDEALGKLVALGYLKGGKNRGLLFKFGLDVDKVVADYESKGIKPAVAAIARTSAHAAVANLAMDSSDDDADDEASTHQTNTDKAALAAKLAMELSSSDDDDDDDEAPKPAALAQGKEHPLAKVRREKAKNLVSMLAMDSDSDEDEPPPAAPQEEEEEMEPPPPPAPQEEEEEAEDPPPAPTPLITTTPAPKRKSGPGPPLPAEMPVDDDDSTSAPTGLTVPGPDEFPDSWGIPKREPNERAIRVTVAKRSTSYLVKVVRACDLKKKHTVHVTLQIVQGNGIPVPAAKARETIQIKKTQAPEWNEEFLFTTGEWTEGCRLQCALWSAPTRFGKGQCLGLVQLERPLTTSATGTHTLVPKNDKDDVQGSLEIEIVDAEHKTNMERQARKQYQKKENKAKEAEGAQFDKGNKRMADYDLKEKLGMGAFGVVMKAVRREDNKVFAMKIMIKDKLKSADAEAVHREVEVLSRLDHENCVRMVESFETTEGICMVMHLLAGGEVLERVKSRPFSEARAAAIVKDLACALSYLHQHDIAHRDVKPQNLMCLNSDPDGPVVLTDFGLAEFSKGDILAMGELCGTPHYLAPEIITEPRSYGKHVDNWAMGVLLYILLSGTPPFSHDDDEQMHKLIRKGKFDITSGYWPNISDDAKDLLSKLFILTPRKRFSADEVLTHRWLKNAPDKPFPPEMVTSIEELLET